MFRMIARPRLVQGIQPGRVNRRKDHSVYRMLFVSANQAGNHDAASDGDAEGSGGAEESSEPLERVAAWVRGNTLWVLGLTPAALLAVSMLGFAKGDLATIKVLSQSVNSLSAVLAIILPAILMSLIAVVFYIWERRLWGEPLPRWAPILSVLISAAAALVLPASLFAIFSVLFILLVLGASYERWIAKSGGQTVRIFNFGTVAIFLVIGTVALGPWLPSEQIKLRSGEPVIGYVIESDSEWTTIQRRTGGALIIRSSDVINREVCNEIHRGRSVVGQLFRWDDRTPLCGDL